MKRLLYILLFVPLALIGQNNLAYLPDTSFVNFLINLDGNLIVNDSLNLDYAEIYEDDWCLSVTGNDLQIYDLEGIQYFSNISCLIISGYSLENIPDLSGLTNLTSLQIEQVPNITSLGDLSCLSSLTYLSVRYTGLTTINLFGISSLEDLFISNNDSLTVISGLSGLTNLNSLGIQRNNLTNIPSLSGLDNLTDLYTEESMLLNVPDISELVNLNHVAFVNCQQITNLPDLSGLINLEILQIVYCSQLTELPELSGLESLTSLVLVGNISLTKLPNLSELENLSLYLFETSLECVEGYPTQLYDDLSDYPPVCANDILDQLNQSFDAWNISIDLSAGWNMFGYGCPTSIDLVQGLSSHTELIAMVKDNNGSAYIPEFDFNGIGDLTPGFGYQIKVTEAIDGFSLCDWYVNDIPEDNIVSLQEENASLQAELDSIYGCTGSWACNYDVTASLDDGSCYNNDLGCGCDTPGPIEGLDCEGNELTQVGDLAQGGIVFYVDETGQNGLVAAMQDLGSYEWGCIFENVNGADGTSIGTGYQNTMDIVNQGCITENGGITAAQAALDAEINGYSDWYLPSKDELYEMYNTIGQGGPEGDIGGFGNIWYWSSSEDDSYSAWFVYFFNGNADDAGKGGEDGAGRVRVIRAFGYTLGCMDSLACNYNPEANMSDGSCTYPELGYDCEGNEITQYQIGDLAEGGIVFYVDETGQHGLVAAVEDLGSYEWGCFFENVNGADGTSIGTGYQNTMDIVNQGCITENGGITAAQAALDAEINGYSDWYLPSKDELYEMYNTIGQGGPEGDIGGFGNIWYWSSSEDDSYSAWFVYFFNGNADDAGKGGEDGAGRVRVIRAF